MVCLSRFAPMLGMLAFAFAAHAQETAAAKTDGAPATPSPAPASSATTPAPTAALTSDPSPDNTIPHRRQRAISGNLATTLAQGMPKYDPPKPVEPKPEEEELPDMRDVDKPRNTIIRLPKVIVEGSKPPIFTKKDVMTPEAYAAMLARRYYSESYLALNRFTQYTPLRLFLPSAEDSALARKQEEDRLQGMSTMSDAASTAARLGDKSESDYIKRTSNETYMSRSDFGWHPEK